MFDNGKLSTILIQFFNERRHFLLNENQLLLSRWTRFCQTSADVSKYVSHFKQRQLELKNEFSDASNRYERLYERNANCAQKQREIFVAEEAKRVRDERNGLAVLKNSSSGKSKETKKAMPSGKF